MFYVSVFSHHRSHHMVDQNPILKLTSPYMLHQVALNQPWAPVGGQKVICSIYILNLVQFHFFCPWDWSTNQFKILLPYGVLGSVNKTIQFQVIFNVLLVYGCFLKKCYAVHFSAMVHRFFISMFIMISVTSSLIQRNWLHVCVDGSVKNCSNVFWGLLFLL